MRLIRAIPDAGLPPGARGTIVMVFATGSPPAYEIEFVDGLGRTLALLTLPHDAVRVESPSEADDETSKHR